MIDESKHGHSPSDPPDKYDVAILGGGLAGLTLALQLKKARPETRILVVEKQKHPVPEAAHKVGESTVEIAARYLRDILGLQEHLETQQLIKYSLRFFFSTNDNRDITKRAEFGSAVHVPTGLDSYQLDRGRLENWLSDELPRQGIRLLDGGKVQQVVLQPQSDVHCLQVLHEGCEHEMHARWVVDASGRSSLLKRQLGLAKKAGHEANAVWFRVGHRIDIDEWSTDPAWHARLIEGKRWLSTNHLMGSGYWVWLIPLASGSTSVGIVTDANLHPFEEMNRFEQAMTWLHAQEPQCAEVIEQHRDKILDFRVMKDFSYNCEQVYSKDRWCLTGEAGLFLDPFYSPGSDLIAISNGLICDLITRNLDGEDIEERAAIHNNVFLLLTRFWFSSYEQQYPVMGNPQIMIAKVVWDTAGYWGLLGLLYFRDYLPSLTDSLDIMMHFARYGAANERVQVFFREWHAIAQPEAVSDVFLRYQSFDFVKKFQYGMLADLSTTELEAQFASNVRLMERAAGQLFSTVIETYADCTGDAAIQSQIQRWQADPTITELITLYQQSDQEPPIDSGWIALGRQKQEVVR